MRLRPLLRAGLILLPALVLAGCGGGDDGEATPATGAACQEVDAPAAKPDGGRQAPLGPLDESRTYRLVVRTSCGTFTITLDQPKAPKTAASLVALAESGFFDDTTFHRVVPGFVIQGGDPTGTGSGGPGYSTVDLPPAGTTYTRGVVAMAKAGFEPPGTSGSQFFVVTGADVGLPPEYAVVGEVTSGMDAVDRIDALGVGDGPPSMPVVIEKVTVSS
jgi:peptidyl-prolyl cis-trans isomerase B (cyclophilin B)